MGNCNCVIRATDISLRSGKYTITLPDGSLSGLCVCEDVLIGIYTSIPRDADCNEVDVTDGTVTLPVYKVIGCECGGGCAVDRWRTTLSCRTILCLKYGGSESLTINGIKGKRC